MMFYLLVVPSSLHFSVVCPRLILITLSALRVFLCLASVSSVSRPHYPATYGQTLKLFYLLATKIKLSLTLA